MRALIVEDDRSTLTLLEYFIQQECQVETFSATSVAEAIRLLEKEKPCAIFLDYWLAGEFADPIVLKVHQLYKDKPPSIVLMTAMRNAGQIAQTLKVGYVVEKPFQLDTFKQVVDIVCEKNK